MTTHPPRPELGSEEFWQRLANNPGALAAQICLIDTVNLDTTLQQHASLYAWVAAAHETAKIDEEKAKWELGKARAQVMISVEGTVEEKKANVELAPGVQAAQARLFTTQERRGALRAMADALEQRKDMLIQISAKQRQERGNY